MQGLLSRTFVMVAVIIALGFAPQVVLNVVNPAIDRTMEQIGRTDPAPDVAPVDTTVDDEETEATDEHADDDAVAHSGAEQEGATE